LNPLDIILVAAIILSGLFGKYSGFNTQLNKLISIILSILITKIVLIEIIIFFIPYIGLSSYTKPLVYFISIGVFYFSFKLIINLLQFSFESSNKNKIIDMVMGVIGGLANGVIALAIVASILFYTFRIDESTIDRLDTSIVFKNIYIIKTILVDYGR